jgi:O-antigen/teichoic acid export membrane protein
MLWKHPVLKNGVISLLGFGVGGFLGYIFQFFISRRLSVAEYGEFQSLVALLGLLGVGSAALSYFVIAHTSVFAHHQDFQANHQFMTWLHRRIAPGLVLLLAVFLIGSIPLRQVLHLTNIWGAVIVSIMAVLSIKTVLYTGAFAGWQNFFAVNTLAVTGTALKLLAGLAVITFIPSASAAALVLFISVTGTWTLARFWSSHALKLQTPISDTNVLELRTKYFAHRRPAHDLSFILGFTFLALWLQNADVLLVKHLATAELAGHYGAFNILGKIILWMNLGIISVVLPIAFAHEHAKISISPQVRLYSYAMIGVTSLGTIALYLAMPAGIIKLTVGDNYLLYASALWLVGLMNALLSILLLESNFAFARRDLAVFYVLGVASLAFAAGIMAWPVSIASVATSGIVAFGLGAGGALLLNLRHPRGVI